MDIAQMQRRIDGADSAAGMIAVAQGYLDGAVLRDTVAAEPLSDADYLAIRRRLPSAVGREREELEELLRLGSRRQQDLAEDDNLTLQR